MHLEFTQQERVAYFTMEIALRAEIPTYAGGLGVLAGDTIRSAADMDLPMVTVTLVSRAGYFRQFLDAQGRQSEQPDPWEPSHWAKPLAARVCVPIESRDVWVAGWLYVLESPSGGRQPVILLDTDLADNAAEDRDITHFLYGGERRDRLKQEIVLGIGGVRMLNALGFKIRHYHMNEGHSALLSLELMNRYAYPSDDIRPGESGYNIPRVREHCNFTTHTPVEAGHDKFSYDMVQEILGEFIDWDILKKLAGHEVLNMTRLALNVSERVNGVAKRHAEISSRMFPGYRVRSITNGVHPGTWTHPAIARLFDTRIPGWCVEPGLLMRSDCCVKDEALWETHVAIKGELLTKVRLLTQVEMSAEVFTIGFARRMTAYKRPDLLFSDLERLRSIARERPLQIVLAGKAHPRDEGGKQIIEALHRHIADLRPDIRAAFLPNYDMDLALALVSGVDLWLNTPLRPLEASGTSGMKAAFNGVPNLSVVDGWWGEGWIEGVTGWAVGDGPDGPADVDAASLYDKLEHTVLPLFYDDHAGWVKVMKGSISKNASFFNSHRMMHRYAIEAYLA